VSILFARVAMPINLDGIRSLSVNAMTGSKDIYVHSILCYAPVFDSKVCDGKITMKLITIVRTSKETHWSCGGYFFVSKKGARILKMSIKLSLQIESNHCFSLMHSLF
jgi:hypothetical protein